MRALVTRSYTQFALGRLDGQIDLFVGLGDVFAAQHDTRVLGGALDGNVRRFHIFGHRLRGRPNLPALGGHRHLHPRAARPQKQGKSATRQTLGPTTAFAFRAPALLLLRAVKGSRGRRRVDGSTNLLLTRQVTSISLANDNQRAMVGGTDSRVYVFDMRSGALLRTIATTPHHCLIQCVKITANDDFLVTAGKL